ncbi:hypothetical protein [Catellatospora citrea]|uniref:Heme peroxidase n=1 Tax=Catellatospora citrea TaxID=53366 RepID=A0A8J3KAQ5_9ACTN|nr:hypothetical protein [Catellatospora citrea]RKE02710.1 hypothetical protein C8E86_8019 [Catellatospora citrea]GIF99542.1 heme peroxidase [Catellatospora citrea]
MDDAPSATPHRNEDMATMLAARVRAEFGDPAGWPRPEGYPDALALCAIDSIQSIGVRYESVGNVVTRYRKFRRDQGGDPAVDGLPQLLRTFEDVGGVEAWAARIGTANRTSTHPGAPLKALAIEQAANALSALDVLTCRDLRACESDQLEAVRSAWCGVPGQGSGTSWRYLLMLAGVPGVKPDRMIIRFVAGTVSRSEGSVSASLAAAVVLRAAEQLGVTATELDHVVWRRQSGRDTDDRG